MWIYNPITKEEIEESNRRFFEMLESDEPKYQLTKEQMDVLRKYGKVWIDEGSKSNINVQWDFRRVNKKAS